MRLQRRPRRRHQRRRPHAGELGQAGRRVRRQVGRRRARVSRRPAVLVEVLGAAHRVAPLDAALGHAVLALQLGGAPRLLVAPPHAPRALVAPPAPQLVVARGPLGATVERLGAQHARAALCVSAERLGARQLGAVVLGRARGGRRRLQRGAVALVVARPGGVGRGRGRGRVRLVAARTVLLLRVVGVVARVAARPGPLGLVAGGGGVAVVAREPGGLQFVRARGGRQSLVALAGAVGRRAGGRLALVALVRVRDAAVVERRRVVERAQLLVERAGQGRHQVTGSCDNMLQISARRAGRGLLGTDGSVLG